MSIRGVLFALCAAPAVVASTTWHVDAAAACPGAGTAVAPFCAIQAALDAAAPGDEIVVAPGLYLERLDFLGKDVLLRSSAGAAATVVDAGSLGSVVSFAHGEGPGAVLRGFTLRNGSGTQTNPWSTMGGGVYCLDASPTIEDNVIELNHAHRGGGLALRGGAPLVSGNLVRDNTADNGGGILCAEGADATLIGNTVRHNGYFGSSGGIRIEDSAALIEANLVEGNLASGGAGIEISSELPVVVRGNVIRDNHTDEDDGGGLLFWPGTATLVEDNDIVDNSAHGVGGGLWAWGGTMRNNRIVSNSGLNFGGGVLGVNCATFEGDLIADNYGGMLVAGSSTQPARLTRVTISGTIDDWGVSLLGGQAVLEDCLFLGNEEGLFAYGQNTLATMRRCTFSGNKHSAVVTEDGARAVLESCIAWGNAASTGLELAPETGSIDASWSIVRLGYPGTGNLDVDPLFADAPAGDYALLPGSPAIDSGDPADGVCGFDRTGMPRRLDGLLDGGSRVDRGALEFGNGRLAVSSPVAGALRIDLQGTPGLSAALLAGLSPGQVCLEKWGTLGLDLGAPSLVLPWSGAPASTTLHVPPALSGLPVVLQALVGPPGFATGNSSNPVLVELP